MGIPPFTRKDKKLIKQWKPILLSHHSAHSHRNRERCTQENLVLMSTVNHHSHAPRQERTNPTQKDSHKPRSCCRLAQQNICQERLQSETLLAQHRPSPTNVMVTQKTPRDTIWVLRGCPGWEQGGWKAVPGQAHQGYQHQGLTMKIKEGFVPTAIITMQQRSSVRFLSAGMNSTLICNCISQDIFGKRLSLNRFFVV